MQKIKTFMVEDYTFEFSVSHPYRKTHLGKHWPTTTQCSIKRLDYVIAIGTVVKHEKDIDNPIYARNYAAKKAITAAGCISKHLRKRIWVEIFKLK